MPSDKLAGETKRVSFGMKMMMFVLGFQIITLGMVLSLWAIEMGVEPERSYSYVEMMTLFGTAAIVSPYLYDGYLQFKAWRKNAY